MNRENTGQSLSPYEWGRLGWESKLDNKIDWISAIKTVRETSKRIYINTGYKDMRDTEIRLFLYNYNNEEVFLSDGYKTIENLVYIDKFRIDENICDKLNSLLLKNNLNTPIDNCCFKISVNDIKSNDEFMACVKDIAESIQTVEKAILSKEFVIGESFGWALEQIRRGMRVQRTGWNGKGMYIEIQNPDETSKMTNPFIFMKTADNNFVPWLASQTDLLANDWILF